MNAQHAATSLLGLTRLPAALNRSATGFRGRFHVKHPSRSRRPSVDSRERSDSPLYEIRTICPKWARWILWIANNARARGYRRLSRRIERNIPGIRYEAEIWDDPLQWQLRNYGKA